MTKFLPFAGRIELVESIFLNFLATGLILSSCLA